MRGLLILALLILALLAGSACSETAAPVPPPSSEEEAVRAAYLDAWAVRDQAVHRGDPGLLTRRFVDGDPSAVVGGLAAGAPSALEVVSDMVTARIERNVDVRGTVEHDIQALAVADDNMSAQVIDRITDRTFLVDRATGARQTSDETTVYTETWFLVKRDREWKVIYFTSRG